MLAAFLSFALMGLWQESVETFALMVSAVTLSLAIGMPLGVLAGRSDRFQRAITPVLDAMQIVPAFAYLMPVVILFSVGPGAAVVTTMIYAIPPAIRITALGIRGVPTNTVEAAEALGSTRKQVLWKVQLPLARRMLLLSVNQVILFALSMVVIAGLIGGPGLGDVVTNGIYSNPALAILAGFAIVIMAIALDRATESMAVRTDPAHRHVTDAVRRRLHLETLAAAAAVLVSVGLAYAFGAGAVYAGRNAQTWLLAQIQIVSRLRPGSGNRGVRGVGADRQLHGEVRPHADGELLRRDPVARDAARVDGDRVPRERATAGYHNVLDARLNRSDRAVGSGDGDCGAGSGRDRSRTWPSGSSSACGRPRAAQWRRSSARSWTCCRRCRSSSTSSRSST